MNLRVFSLGLGIVAFTLSGASWADCDASHVPTDASANAPSSAATKEAAPPRAATKEVSPKVARNDGPQQGGRPQTDGKLSQLKLVDCNDGSCK